MNEHETLMKEAVNLSLKAIEKNHGGPFGAVIVKDGKIIAEGYNQVIKTNDPTAHAEIIAIREASRVLNSFDLSGCEIYTSAEPCPMCFAACYWANIGRIYYANTKKDAEKIGFKDNFIYEEIKSALNKTNKNLIRIETKEAIEVFKKWEQKQDKIPY